MALTTEQYAGIMDTLGSLSGYVGATGPTGAVSTTPGPTGASGPAGAASSVPGPTGASGAAGAAVRFGATAPTGGLGSVGDAFMCTANGALYSKTGASTWTLEYTCTGS